MSLLSLPNEVLEKIAQLLDRVSLAAFAVSDHRLNRATMIRQVREQIMKSADDVQNMDRIGPAGSSIVSLDLSNERSSKLEALILECPELRVLNVVNADLKFTQLMKILDNLASLDTMSCSFLGLPPENVQEHQVLRAQRSIRKLFIDFSPSLPLFLYLASFLDNCSRIETVHLNFIGRFLHSQDLSQNPFPKRSPRWQSLHTVVGSFHLSSKETVEATLRLFLDLCNHSIRKCFIRDDLGFVPFYVQDVRFSPAAEVIITKDIKYLVPQHEHGSKLRLTAFDSLERPSLIKQLDLADLYMSWANVPLPWHEWRIFPPILRSIACHVCQLPTESDMDPNRFPQKRNLIEELEQARLIKLHIIVGRERYSDETCHFCRHASSRYVLGDLSRLRFLEEFTLVGVKPRPVLFESVANANIRVMKLCLTQAPPMQGFQELLTLCKGLRFFKFEAPDLPLHSPLLWSALAKGPALKQICLASNSMEEVDLNMLEQFLPAIFRNVDMLHIHSDRHRALQNHMCSYVNKVNSKTPHRNVAFLGPGIESGSGVKRHPDWSSMPGRNLCCTPVLIGMVELDGWNKY